MSIKINIYNQKAETVGELSLPENVFSVEVNEALVHQAAVTQMANERQVLAHTKDRSEVRGGGRKPWRQKGTGRARHGSSRSPIWIGGGVTFGPRKDRNFKKKINKKMKQKALSMVLSDKLAHKRLVVLDKLEIDEFKTKKFDAMVKKLEKELNKTAKEQKDKGAKRSVLMVNDRADDQAKYSSRNLPGLELIRLENINILNLLRYRDLFLTKSCIEKLTKNHDRNKK